MCGIVGYIGKKDAYPILIKGLKRLEYRGYDSAGVALISKDQQLNVYKAKGKVSELEEFVAQKDISGNIGIAHTRWATHGNFKLKDILSEVALILRSWFSLLNILRKLKILTY
ncbi:MAG: glmS [Bacteroidetes bacterium]|nr:glmS [Bacteroidota bacterium]